MKRRDFLKYLGAGGVGTAAGFILGKVSKVPGAKLIPYVVPPEENIVPGVATWYSSLCSECGAGCGTVVRVLEGRAKKIEGNAKHPVSRGKLCVRGQASLQTLYNPDRIKGPLRRTGDRGTGIYMEISWEEAFSALSKGLSAAGGDGLYLLTSPLKGHLKTLVSGITEADSANHIEYDLFQHQNLIYANQVTMGLSAIPHYNIEHTKYLLSFGADFGSTWLSPAHYTNAYGEMRQGGKDNERGKLVHVEPRMSLTAASADEWVPAKPGTEGILALSMAHVIVEKGYYKGSDASSWKSTLARYTPAYAASVTDVAAERIEEMAKGFATTRPSLAIGGESLSSYENGVSGLVAVNILNHVAGNIGIKGGVIPNPEAEKAGKAGSNNKISTLIAAANSAKAKALVIYNTNPVFTTPKSAKTAEALKRIPFIASFSSFMDETTAYADIILPSHTPLEDWGDDYTEPSVGYAVATIRQPVVSPVFDTKSVGDIFLTIAKGSTVKAASGKAAARFSAQDFADYMKASWKETYSKNRSMSASSASFDDFWNKLLQNGGWWPAEEPKRKVTVSATAAAQHISATPAKFEGGAEFPFYLVMYSQAGLRDGKGANLPWIQELPDPMTSVVWGTWVEINPRTARNLGVKEGDFVAIESPFGKINAHVYLFPGIRPDTVAVPIGQGHTLYGRYAKDRGANPIEVLPAKEDAKTGVYALNATRVRIAPSSLISDKFVKMEGSTKELGREIVQTVPLAEFKKMKKETV